ncbi:MAG: asparaginase [Burkholderiaceae bacterium]|nr:asparaginase [Burkholderiaceae bacterium]
MSPRHVPLVETTRGGTTECVHYGSIAVVDTNGRLVASAGDPESINFTRSSLKPLQALPFVEDGGLAHYGFGSHELALMCASHNGEAVHVSVVQRILARVGLDESALQCGCHAPSYFAATETPAPTGVAWSSLHHNCSGKHAGFLAYCRLHRLPVENYLDSGHPLQQRIRTTASRFAHGDTLAQAIDGCSAPNFAMPLKRLAELYAWIAAEETPESKAITFAMAHHPDLVSGTRRADLAIMQSGRGDWISKVGADGMQAIGVRSQGLGIAIRIADGNSRAVNAATVEVLEQLDLLDDPSGTPLAVYDCPPIRNYRGIETGGVVPVLKLIGH